MYKFVKRNIPSLSPVYVFEKQLICYTVGIKMQDSSKIIQDTNHLLNTILSFNFVLFFKLQALQLIL